jgi:hypothetical protein
VFLAIAVTVTTYVPTGVNAAAVEPAGALHPTTEAAQRKQAEDKLNRRRRGLNIGRITKQTSAATKSAPRE